ncbi:adenosylcobinamide-GDP ribazoletransferase [Rhodobacteraceae bacterium CCMM004]|nr:adenosylcobinamide-GDP ribazoletransferase [Rhodobacteraceae bacterium CCMM004]
MAETGGPRAGDVAAALALLSRVPVRADHRRGAAAAWAWPVAGALLAAMAAAAGWAALALGLPAAAAAGLVLAVQVATTGAMHEDGLADTADGLWGGADPARRLEIMKDSRIGAYGVLALILGVGLRWTLLTALFAAGTVWAPLIAAGMVSRAAIVAAMRRLPPARPGGLSALVGRPAATGEALALALGLAGAVVLCGAAGLGAALAAAAAAVGLGQLARAKIGGQTGDILGAVQQVAEIAALTVLAAAL